MEILKFTQKEWMTEDTKTVKGGLHRISYGVVDSPVVIVHKKSQVDEAVCAELGYGIVESFCNGGTVVVNKGDLLLGHFYKPQNGWCDRFVSYFVDWLKSKGLNAERDNNDVLVDGYKVCGTGITSHGRIDYTSVFIAINTNLDHIKAICKKAMEKVPKGLSEYGITTDEAEQMFLDFCEQDKQTEEAVKKPATDPEERYIPDWKALEIILGGEV